jgi:F-type H+-transporting ATPase subunit delta
MAEIVTVARPYAEAAFRLAKEQGQLTAWFDALSSLATVVENEEVSALIDNPKVSAAQLEALFFGIVGDKVSAEVKNFVQLLVANKRLALLPEIARQFEQLKLEAEQSVDADIVSAYPLSDAQVADIGTQLQKRFGRQVRAQVTVDPDLMGGVRITVGDVVIDASVRGKLQAMAVELKG